MSADEDTIPTAQAERLVEIEPRVVATIAYHPEPLRVGQRAILGRLDKRFEAQLSRHAPEFFAETSPAGTPLLERHVSRKAVVIRGGGGGATLEVPPGVSLHLDGEDVSGSRSLAPAALGRGVVLRTGWVVLVLHTRAAVARRGEDYGLVGRSAAVEVLRDHIERVAREPVSVLIHGESGAGKELVARAIHRSSPRSGGPFVALNMGAVPAGTAAAELFGHAPGAYTGAVGEHHGAFGAAHGGTLFLDEIGACGNDVQLMLLRALETREVRRVGDRSAPRRVDLRVLAATDADLHQAVRRGSFRLPLLHRLAGYELVVPPLRERRDDIGPLLLHFLRDLLGADAALLGPRDPPWLPPSVVERLLLHDFPGNVRELRNIAHQLVIAGRGRSEAVLTETVMASLEAALAAAPRPTSRRAPGDIGHEELLAVLRAHDFEPTAAARALGISKTTIYALMERPPGIRTAKDLSREEIVAVGTRTGGDLARMASELAVSLRALKRRMTELEIH